MATDKRHAAPADQYELDLEDVPWDPQGTSSHSHLVAGSPLFRAKVLARKAMFQAAMDAQAPNPAGASKCWPRTPSRRRRRS